MKLIHLSTLMLVFLLIALACDQDTEPEIEPARLSFNFDLRVGDQTLEFGKVYTINGTAVSFDVVDYYVGGILFTQADGTTVNLEEQYLLASDTANLLNGEITISDITSIKFFVGVDALTNRQSENDFTTRPTSDPLGLQDPAMHWNWMTGYKFLRVDGNADTDGDGAVDQGIAYHLGSDALLKDFEIQKNIPIVSGLNRIRFTLDLAKFFSGVDLSTELDTHTSNNLPLAERLHASLGSALTLN